MKTDIEVKSRTGFVVLYAKDGGYINRDKEYESFIDSVKGDFDLLSIFQNDAGEHFITYMGSSRVISKELFLSIKAQLSDDTINECHTLTTLESRDDFLERVGLL